MNKDGTVTEVLSLPDCDICRARGFNPPHKAHYDGKTFGGPWAHMCEAHFDVVGVGLGVGRGQRLVVAK